MIHGEDRWIRRKHGKRKHRGWRKLHIGVSHGLIVANHLTDERGCDGAIAPTLIGQTGHIDSIVADKGYDQIGVCEAAQTHPNKNGKIMIHPGANGVISPSGEAGLRQRNQHIKSINEDGVLNWRRTSGYYRQSEVENMLYQYKTLPGDQLRARGEDSRQVASILACNILNQFRLLGRPECELVA